MNSNPIAKQLADSRKEIVYVEAPAGCGKTYTIAEAVSYSNHGKQLILTHTHAGVASLRHKLRQLRVNNKLFYVDTIDGFAQRLITSFPELSQHREEMEWHQKRKAALKVLDGSFAHQILAKSFDGIYVDEYQDCSFWQHQIILSLSSYIPCKIFGDPLQGIFDFDKKESAIDWDQDVAKKIERLGILNHPYRWTLDGGNKDLGDWLMSIREQLRDGVTITLPSNNALVSWAKVDDKNRMAIAIAKCKGKTNATGSVIAIVKRDGLDHQIAKKLKGTYRSIEEIEGKRLIDFAKDIDKLDGNELALAMIGFTQKCVTSSAILALIKQKIEKGSKLIIKNQVPSAIQVTSAFKELQEANGIDAIKAIKNAMNNLEQIEDTHIACMELWIEAKRMLDLSIAGKADNMVIAAKKTREQTRVIGRYPDSRLISRVLLIKGLEFDHAIVVDADQMTAQELYVAMSRGKRSLTMLSKERTISPIRRKKPKKEETLQEEQLSMF